MFREVKVPRQLGGLSTPQCILLNVGGTVYMTSQATLTRYQESLLGKMFTQKRTPLAVDDHGRFFIDRDGTLFRHILNYLRDGKVNLPEDFREHQQFLDEAKFYQLEDLVEKLCISLNVNGVYYSTTRALLTKYENSSLAIMFSNNNNMPRRDVEGRYILKADGGDGHLFQYILNFLEHEDLQLPCEFDKFAELEKEVEYYKLTKAMSHLQVFRVSLVVGGEKVQVERAILIKEKGSYLEEIFRQIPIPLERDQHERYVLNGNANIFRYFLDYLKNGEHSLAGKSFYHYEYEAEVDFYKLGLPKPKVNIALPAAGYINNMCDCKVSWRSLTKYKGSLLEEKFAKARVGQTTTLESDFDTFRYIIRFLEYGEVPISSRQKVLEEARRYRLHELERLLTNNK